MEITVRHEVHLHLDHVAINLLTQIRNITINKGNEIMAAIDDVKTALGDLENTTSSVIQPLLTNIGTELTTLSAALKAALDAGSTATLSPIKDRLDALNTVLKSAAKSLADIGTAADDPLAVPPATSFTDRPSFDAGVAAYTGGSAVTLDSNDGNGSVEVRPSTPGDTSVLAYYFHSATGGIDMVGPAD